MAPYTHNVIFVVIPHMNPIVTARIFFCAFKTVFITGAFITGFHDSLYTIQNNTEIFGVSFFVPGIQNVTEIIQRKK